MSKIFILFLTTFISTAFSFARPFSSNSSNSLLLESLRARPCKASILFYIKEGFLCVIEKKDFLKKEETSHLKKPKDILSFISFTEEQAKTFEFVRKEFESIFELEIEKNKDVFIPESFEHSPLYFNFKTDSLKNKADLNYLIIKNSHEPLTVESASIILGLLECFKQESAAKYFLSGYCKKQGIKFYEEEDFEDVIKRSGLEEHKKLIETMPFEKVAALDPMNNPKDKKFISSKVGKSLIFLKDSWIKSICFASLWKENYKTAKTPSLLKFSLEKPKKIKNQNKKK